MHFSKFTIFLLICALPLIWIYNNMKKVIFFALVIVVIAWHTDIYDFVSGVPSTVATAQPVVIGAPHSNNPAVMSSGPMGAPAASEPESSFDLTQWLKDHTPKK